MRKRLYQALPENSKLIDSVRSATEEKKKKRLYAENNVKGREKKAESVSEYDAPLAELFTSAAKQLDTLYAMYECYENECIKIPLTLCSSFHHSAETAAKILEWYVHTGEIAWKTGFSVANESVYLPMQSLFVQARR